MISENSTCSNLYNRPKTYDNKFLYNNNFVTHIFKNKVLLINFGKILCIKYILIEKRLLQNR